MKILVAVKRVVDAKIKVRPLPDHSGVDVKLAKMAMNPFDEIAIEKAVTLREAGVADEVVAVTVGPLKAVDTLRVAMAIGADRAVHVRTEESLEPLAVAKVLRAVVEREKPDLVLLGLSLIHISEPTRRTPISYAVFCLKKKKKRHRYNPTPPTTKTNSSYYF